jgi:hypothetical protein
MTLLLGIVTLGFVAGAAWLKFHSSPAPEPPAIGSPLPPLRLMNLETSEPLLLLGLKGKVVWVVFWSAASPSGREVLPRLEEAWKRLRSHRRFTLVTAAVDSEHPDTVRELLERIHASLPAYLATPETSRQFGAEEADPPLHLLIDTDGRIAALTRGAGPGTINRLADRIRGWLEDLDPLGPTRFAGVSSTSPVVVTAQAIELSRQEGRTTAPRLVSPLNRVHDRWFLDGSF